MGEPKLCRYFANGMCSKGDRCFYSHDRREADKQVCQFYLAGTCSFGNTCRFHHIKPKSRASLSSTSTQGSSKAAMKAPPPVKLVKPGLNVNAPAFVPSWEKNNVKNYASVAGGSSSVDNIESKREESNTLCPYYYNSGECSRMEIDCPFVHGDRCDMCNTWCLYPDSVDKRKEHFKVCTKTHEEAMERAFIEQKSHEKTCGICMEKIFENNMRFGILTGCRHCFCLSCIREWRSKHETTDLESKVVRSCPECRQHSDYVIPSVIWVEEEDEKNLLIQIYQENTKKKVCKYYTDPKQRGACPFGNKCFYRHQLPDGSIDPGESPKARRRPRLSDFLFYDSLSSDDENMDYFHHFVTMLSHGPINVISNFSDSD